MSTTRRRPQAVRFLALGLASAALGALLVVLPQPSVALAREMELETAAPPLEPVAAPESPAAAAVVEELQHHAEIGPLAEAPAGSAEDGGAAEPAPTTPAQLEGERLTGTGESDDFAMIGLKWEGDGHEPAMVRVQADGVWGEWFSAETGGHGPDPVTGEPLANGSTDPIWVEHAQAYEVDLPADATEVEVVLVREGDTTVEVADGTAQAGAAARGGPPMHLRGEWGAAPYNGTPDYGTTLGRAIVHHTVNGNGYSQGQVANMIRGIQAFHQGSNGWSDIGYNFVVDRFGGIWEGRQGGVTRPVIGAHAQGSNTNTVGIAGLGDFTSAGPGSAMVDSIGNLAGWKLSLHGTTPNTGNVLGHRNVGQSSCPGNGLYAQLGAIASVAASNFAQQHPAPSFAQRGWTVSGSYLPVAGDFDGDLRGDIVWYGPGGASDYSWWGNSNRTWAGRGVTISGTYQQPVSGDFDGNGRDDILLYGPGAASDAIFFGGPNRTFAARNYTVGGTSYDPVVADFNADGREDVFWYAPGTAQDVVWYGNANRTFTARLKTVDGVYVPAAGDFDGDGHGDVLWYGEGAAADNIWWGADGSAFTSTPANIGAAGYQPLVGDFNRNGRADVIFYKPGTGSDPIWIGYGNRTFGAASTTINGTSYLPLVEDFDANFIHDVFWYGPGTASDSTWYGQ
jgi:hypothetical protein